MSEQFCATLPAEFVHTGEVAASVADHLCGDNRVVAGLVRRIVARLARPADEWSLQAKRMRYLGLASAHLAGRLTHILDLPGNLALIQLAPEKMLMAVRSDDRWDFLGDAGQRLSVSDLLAADPALDSAFLESIVLRIPFGIRSPLGLDSLGRLWPLLRAAWAEIGIASLFVNVGQLLLPLFSMLVYDKVVSNGVFETLWALVIGMLIYLATEGGMRLVRALATERIAHELTERSDESLWQRLGEQVDGAANGVARFLTRYRDLSLSRDFISSSYLLALIDIPFLLLYLIAIGLIAWPMLIVSSLLVVSYALIGLALQRQVARLSQLAETSNAQKLTFLGEMLGALDVLRTVPGAALFLRRWRDLYTASSGHEEARRLTMNHASLLSSSMMTFSTVAMLTAGAYLIDIRWLSVGGLIACNLLAGRAMALVSSLFSVIGKWQDFSRAAERMERDIAPVPEKNYVSRRDTKGAVRVIGVEKHYENRPPALLGVSFSALPGERIALLGRPGAGKSTLLRSIAGVCAPDAGQILVDGVSLHDISTADRALWLSWKSQDPALFAGTLEDNLRVALRQSDSARLSQALWASCLEDELSSGRMTLGMQIADHGANLSGGQRQKVALARVLAQPARIVLLDEPTLGLDPDTERLLAARLREMLGPEALLIMTTHSATMLGVAERVIAMESGRIIADGPRDKLVHVG